MKEDGETGVQQRNNNIAKLEDASMLAKTQHDETMANGVVLDSSGCSHCKSGLGVTSTVKKKLRVCSKRRAAQHCSDECWRAGWKSHRKECPGVPAAKHMCVFLDKQQPIRILHGYLTAQSNVDCSDILCKELCRKGLEIVCGTCEEESATPEGLMLHSIDALRRASASS